MILATLTTLDLVNSIYFQRVRYPGSLGLNRPFWADGNVVPVGLGSVRGLLATGSFGVAMEEPAQGDE